MNYFRKTKIIVSCLSELLKCVKKKQVIKKPANGSLGNASKTDTTILFSFIYTITLNRSCINSGNTFVTVTKLVWHCYTVTFRIGKKYGMQL